MSMILGSFWNVYSMTQVVAKYCWVYVFRETNHLLDHVTHAHKSTHLPEGNGCCLDSPVLIHSAIAIILIYTS